MIKQSDIEILERFSKGLSNAKETEYIYALFDKNEGNKEFKKYIESLFNVYLADKPDEDYKLSYLLDRIHHTIHVRESKKKLPVFRQMYQWYSAVAAILLIPLMIAGGLWIAKNDQMVTAIEENLLTSNLFAPPGSRINFTLPDGTEGWLNSGSSIEYNLPFSHNRKVSVNGEAWFDVVHDNQHPFEITAGASTITVLGTKFNVRTYPQEGYLEIALEEGKVELTTPGLQKGVIMKQDEHLVLRDKAIKINTTDASKYSAWKEGKLVFRGDSMDEVARRIERWYNVNVELVDSELRDYSFRGTFIDDSLEEVLRYLSMTSPIRYNVVDRMQQPDGTISKKKILLYKKALNN